MNKEASGYRNPRHYQSRLGSCRRLTAIRVVQEILSGACPQKPGSLSSGRPYLVQVGPTLHGIPKSCIHSEIWEEATSKLMYFLLGYEFTLVTCRNRIICKFNNLAKDAKKNNRIVCKHVQTMFWVAHTFCYDKSRGVTGIREMVPRITSCGRDV